MEAQITSRESLRATIEYLCRLLASYDIQITAETLRQAKFDGEAARAPLLRALHDLALVHALGWPRGAGAGVAALHELQRAEALDGGAALPAAGEALLLHLLSSWGCPPGLLARLATPAPSSRALLLALAWLVSACGLFARAMSHLATPPALAPLLPPLPQDPSAAPAARDAARAAAAEAGARAARAAGARGALQGWPRAEAVAQQALAGLGALRARVKLLGCLLDGRERLTAAVLDLQQQQQQQQQQQHAGRPPPTPLELAVSLAQRALQQHEAALAGAAALVERQAECARHAGVFFAWAASAFAEEERERADAAAAAAAAAGGGGAVGGAPEAAGGAAWEVLSGRTDASGGGGGAAGRQGRPGVPVSSPAGAGPWVPLSEVAPLVSQLPPAAGAPALPLRVLARVAGQLEAAAAAAGVPLPPETQSDLDLLGGLRLDGGDGAPRLPARLQPFAEAVAAALHQAGVGVLPDPSLQALPPDILERLAAAGSQQQQQQQQQPQQEEEQEQQRQQGESAAQGVAPLNPAALAWRRVPARPARGAGGAAPPPPATGAVAADDELERLRLLALAAAKRLARVRAANRQRLAAAAALLCGEPGGGAARGGGAGAGGREGACGGCVLIEGL